MSCETDSSTFNEEGNTCDCDPGYATLSLVGYEHQCEAKCDPDTTEYDEEWNECYCKDGWDYLTTDDSTDI
jgi:hypothetical protein